MAVTVLRWSLKYRVDLGSELWILARGWRQNSISEEGETHATDDDGGELCVSVVVCCLAAEVSLPQSKNYGESEGRKNGRRVKDGCPLTKRTQDLHPFSQAKVSEGVRIS